MKQSLIGVLVGVLMAVGGLGAQAEPATDARYYDDAKVVRVRTVDGEAMVQRSYEEGNEAAVANLPVFEGDTVVTTEGRVELYLGRGNFLRLDVDTEILLRRAPALRRTDFSVKIVRGGVYLEVGALDNERDIEVQTPDCGLFVLDQGLFRINAIENGQTEVYVHGGSAEVAGESSSRTVRENQKTVWQGGRITERPFYFYASDRDEFDRWQEELGRDSETYRYSSARYLERGYEDYEYELNRSGRWTYQREYGCNVWTPYSVGADWRPYSNGRWVWHPHYGYVWSSYDPWGWVTHHYGRWHWDTYLGWSWVPGYHWSPAWVSWGWDDDYYCWSPLSYWNRPIFIFGHRWDRNYDHHRRGFPHGDRSTVIIRKNELGSANYAKVGLRRETLSSGSAARAITFHGAAPASRFAVNRVSRTDSMGRTVIFKENAVIAPVRGRVQSGTSSLAQSTTTRGTLGRRVFRAQGEGSGKYSGGGEQQQSSAGTVVRRKYSGGSGSRAGWGRGTGGEKSSGTVIRKDEAAADADRPRVRRDDSAKSTGESESAGSKARKKDESTYFSARSGDAGYGYKAGSSSAPVRTSRSSDSLRFRSRDYSGVRENEDRAVWSRSRDRSSDVRTGSSPSGGEARVRSFGSSNRSLGGGTSGHGSSFARSSAGSAARSSSPSSHSTASRKKD